MTRINRDTRVALACALRIQGPRLETVALFGGFPSPNVDPGIYDRVDGHWVLRDDGGSVALQHRAKSSGALGTPERNHTCPACEGAGAMGVEGIGAVCCPRCAGCGERKFDREPADHAFPGGAK